LDRARHSRCTLSPLSGELATACLLFCAIEIAAALRALLQEQMLAVKDDGLGTLDFREDWGFQIEAACYPIAWNETSESQIDVCRKCGEEIDPSRRVDFTLKDGTRVCESCFVKGTRRPKIDWPN
jgi:hypothetical protein